MQVMFWDMRVDRLLKKGRKADESLDLVWKATHIVPLINLQGESGFRVQGATSRVVNPC